MNIVEALSFDDVLLVPKYSEVKSRSEVSLAVGLSKGFKFDTPIVPSNMKTICELEMAKLFYNNKSLAVLHRFIDFKHQLNWIDEIKNWGNDVFNYIGFSVGVKKEDYNKVDELYFGGVKIICIDVAHGDSIQCVNMTKYIAEKYPDVLLISGNVATGNGAITLWKSGADIVRVGIGGGSLCTTRIMTGNGVVGFTSIKDCFDAKLNFERQFNKKVFLMQDGGLHSSGCLSKALCFADFCMIGSLFSGTDEASGEIIELNNIKYKKYVGSSTHKKDHIEGVESLKKYKGSGQKVIKILSDGIKSCCSYQGVFNLNDLKINPIFMKHTQLGLNESNFHHIDLKISDV